MATGFFTTRSDIRVINSSDEIVPFSDEGNRPRPSPGCAQGPATIPQTLPIDKIGLKGDA